MYVVVRILHDRDLVSPCDTRMAGRVPSMKRDELTPSRLQGGELHHEEASRSAHEKLVLTGTCGAPTSGSLGHRGCYFDTCYSPMVLDASASSPSQSPSALQREAD